QQVARDLRLLADPAENAGADDLLFRVEAVADSLFHFATSSDTEIDPTVFTDLEEVVHRLSLLNSDHATPGRPSHILPVETLESYLIAGLSVRDTAVLFGVGGRTVYRHMAEHGIRVSDLFTSIDNGELDATVRRILSCHPNTGYEMMVGHLKAPGIRIQRHRVQEAMRREAPEGMRTLRLQTLRGRRYTVPSPNSLWHIDGNHKLIRWRIVVHGGIDGFSRSIVYLNVATNKRASTVLGSFLKAVNTYGVPSRVGSDKGGENVQVAHFMLSTRGLNRNSYLTGRSRHNQRMERLWRDVFGGVLDLFYTIFCNLEREGLFNPD
ncbi:hypothetical protein NFI96_017023, partial [Prochilodus magdalenae]